MMVPPLSERPVTEEDEEQFRRESAPRKYTLRRRWADYRAEVKNGVVAFHHLTAEIFGKHTGNHTGQDQD